MRKTWRYIIFLLLLTFFFISCEQEKNLISLQNKSGESLYSKAIVIHRADLNVNKEEYILIDHDGEDIPVQFDDLNQDGVWDEVVFLYDFSPNETVDLNLMKVKEEEVPDYPSRANVHLGVSVQRNNRFKSVSVHETPKDYEGQNAPYLYQYEGPVWESELIAFRLHFDSRNSKDIFGKTKARLYADSVGLGEDYHTLRDLGMEILKVGSSLGAGSLALLKNDSLYRLTETGKQKFELISDGPLRAIFRLTYNGWIIAGKEYNLEENITIRAGSRWYESQVTLTGETESDTLATGIADLHDASKSEKKLDEGQIKYLHGKISENNDYIGMGIYVPEQYFAGFDEAPTEGEGVINTSLVYLVPSNDICKFIFYVGWEGEDQRFNDQQYFENQLIKEIQSVNKEVEVKVKANE